MPSITCLFVLMTVDIWPADDVYNAYRPEHASYIKDAVSLWHQSVRIQLVGRLYAPLTPCTDYTVPRTRTKFGDRAIGVAWPSTRNSLPESLRRTDCTETFKRRLKTHFLTSTWDLLCFNFSQFYWLLHVMLGRSGST